MGTPKTLTREMVAEAFAAGKSAQQIATEFGVKINSVYAHSRRLRQDKLQQGGQQSQLVHPGQPGQEGQQVQTQVVTRTVTKTENIDYEKLLDAFLRRIEMNIELTNKVQEQTELINRLENIRAAQANEIVVLKDEIKNKPAMQERLKNIARNINMEQHNLVAEAVN